MNNQEWVPIFEEFANKVLKYKDNRKELLETIFEIFEDAEIDNPYHELTKSGNHIKLKDIDPFWVISINNRYNSNKRFEILKSIKDIMKLKSDVPSYLAGIPIIIPFGLKFYSKLKDVENGFIDKLWNFYKCAIDYANKQTNKSRTELIEYLNNFLQYNNIKWNLTVFLYDIRPNFYINLDETNQKYLKHILKDNTNLNFIIDNMKKENIGETYLDFCEEMRNACNDNKYNFDSLPDLSEKANNYKNNTEPEISPDAQYWVYAPGRNASEWEDFYENDIMAIGWPYAGDISKYESVEQIMEEINCKKGSASQLWDFYNSIKVGDVVYAKKGKSIIVGKGVVESECYFDADEEEFKNYRKINWYKKGYWENTGIYYVSTLNNITNRKSLIDKIENELKTETSDDTEPISYQSENIIFYGVPGCGKSYYVENNYIENYEEKKKQGQIKRVVFHPDYTYSDFVGHVLPKTNSEGQIKYEFVPGPFTRILEKAYNDDKEYYLIIEEINRGNAPAIFGDLFQLLDRKDGKSEYEIENQDIQDIVCPDESNIIIPENLTIIATMNTSDQNVFTLDTAFQRRWTMRLIKNEFDKNDSIQDLLVPKTKVKWSEFWKKINEAIVKDNNNNSMDDKRLGTHFVDKEDLCNGNETDKEAVNKQNRFVEKVFKYLWDDAFKMNRENIFKPEFNTLEEVVGHFSRNNKLNEIFDVNFEEIQDN